MSPILSWYFDPQALSLGAGFGEENVGSRLNWIVVVWGFGWEIGTLYCGVRRFVCCR